MRAVHRLDRLCAPVVTETDEALPVTSETGGAEGWAGARVTPALKVRFYSFEWRALSWADWKYLEALEADMMGGAGLVAIRPAVPLKALPSGTVSQQSTIVGRLVGPFEMEALHHDHYRVRGTIRESL